MQWRSGNLYWEQASGYLCLSDYVSFAKKFLNTLLVHTVVTARVHSRRKDDHAMNAEVLNQSGISELFRSYWKLVKVQTSKGEVDPVYTGETAPDNHWIRWWVAPRDGLRRFLEKNLLPLTVIHQPNKYRNYNLEPFSGFCSLFNVTKMQ
jgi:hypothetical protein